MKFGAYIPFSLVDYPGNPAAVIFTAGCNMTCPYCHNDELSHDATISLNDILTHLEERSSILSHVVISGGEPTLHEDLPLLCKAIKALGYKIKLDTNGTNPQMLKLLIDQSLVDFLAMDIKTSPSKYHVLTSVPFKDIEDSIGIIKTFDTYEFRTTCYPEVGKDDIQEIMRNISKEHYVLQSYRKNHEHSPTPNSHTTLNDWAHDFHVPLR